MVQGAVYGAVNAVDRHGRPYLVNRRFPMASSDAAAATAAFRVLDSLFPTQHATLQAAYDISLAGMPAGPLKQTGIDVGTTAASAILAESHDGRTLIGARSGPALRACGSHWPVRRELRCAIRARGSGMQFRSWSRARRSSAPRARCHSRVPPTRPSFNEVKAIGSLNSATRIAAQSHAAAFWQTNPAATTTPSLAGSSTTSRLTRATARACSRCST